MISSNSIVSRYASILRLFMRAGVRVEVVMRGSTVVAVEDKQAR